MLYKSLRPLLFKLDPEKAHTLSLTALDKVACFLPSQLLEASPTTVMGINFPNKVGLAAGLDKNGSHIDGLGKLGFGFIEVGTVTPRAQAGNAKPRLFRIESHDAIINRMGFNNDGVERLVSNVKKSHYSGVLGINIGKNKDTPNEKAGDDYLACLRAVYQHADYITANVSSPNTVGLRDLQSDDSIKRLIDMLKSEQEKLSASYGYKPVAIKIAPDLTDEAIVSLAAIFISREVDGIITTNTTIDKSCVATHRFGLEAGGLSGKPLMQQSTHVIRLLADELKGSVPIIGVGGINSGQDAADKITAGASLVQIYSGLIYKGPQLIKDAVSATS